MKKEKKTIFGIAAFVLAIVLAACSGPTDPNPNPDPNSDPEGGGELFITGKFTTDAGTSYFTAQKSTGGVAANIRQPMSRAVSATQVPLSGTLDDGDITFRLKGFYDEESGAYTLQAASSVIKYSISGTANGNATASVATRTSASEPFGPPTFVQVTTEISDDELSGGMTSTGEADIVEGFTRDDIWGVWYYEDTWGEIKFVVNEWGMTGMMKQDGVWGEGQTFGFSKIIENEDGSITTIGDATVINYKDTSSGGQEDYEDFIARIEAFTAWAESKGYQTYDGQHPSLPLTQDGIRRPLPITEIFGRADFPQQEFPEFEEGALVKGSGTYFVQISYEPDGRGTAETPFVYWVKKRGDDYQFENSSDLLVDYDTCDPAATLEGALEGALTVIKATGDTAAKYDPLPWTISTAGVKTGLAVAAWMAENPYPEYSEHFTPEQLQAYNDDYDVWHDSNCTFIKQQLLANFPQKFPNPDTLLMDNTAKYWELYDQFKVETGKVTIEYSTEYYKWNLVEDNGKLIIKMYSSDGTADNAYAESYAEAEAFSQLITTPLATLSR